MKIGDVLITSGLGARFPAGFPVGNISALHPDDSHAFLVGEITLNVSWIEVVMYCCCAWVRPCHLVVEGR